MNKTPKPQAPNRHQMFAIENFDPAHWYDILLAGPRRDEQMAGIQQMIRSVERLRDTPRLVIAPELYQRVLDLHPSPSNALEFCLGTLAEMPGADVVGATRRYAGQSKIAYVHFRNIVGHAPEYREVFVDEGEIDMPRIVRVLHDKNFDGVLIPDPYSTDELPGPVACGHGSCHGLYESALG